MFKFLIILGLLFYVTVSAQAQQTIFNVPTTDVLNRGQVYVELDASFKTNNESVLHRFSSFVPRVVVGVGNNVEVGLNVTGNIQPGLDSTTLVPTAKWKFYEKKVTALIAGTNLYIPIRNRGYNFGSYSYLAVSRTLNKTRLTAGGYVASKNVFFSPDGCSCVFRQAINPNNLMAFSVKCFLSHMNEVRANRNDRGNKHADNRSLAR